MATVTHSVFKGGVQTSASYQKTSTAIVVNEFISPKEGYEPNGATISALAHGPYITISIENWSYANPTIYIANPFSFALVDVLVHTIDPFTVTSNRAILNIYPKNGTIAGVKYIPVDVANAIARNPLYDSFYKSFVGGEDATSNSFYGKAVSIANVTILRSALSIYVSGTGLGGTFKGTITLKVIPINEGYADAQPNITNFG
tara:strand:- start:5626 stop:6231 length:606 start_codon:yes stop_codon:yes gene_type:complete